MRMFALLFVLLVDCSTPRAPDRTLYVHADPDFTPTERQTIHEATRILATEGNVAVCIAYDLDTHNRYGVTMTRVTSQSDLVKQTDQWFQGIVFAWTRSIPRTEVFVATDRLITERLALHVYLHELLHALGVDHVADPKAVMYGSTDEDHMAVKLSPADLEGLLKTVPTGIRR